jgi:GNAT superfamily N-acetyltransferase
VDRRRAGFGLALGLGALAAGATGAATAGLTIRAAASEDVPGCATMVETARVRLEGFEPRLWRRAAGAAAATQAFFARLIDDPQALFLVAMDKSALVGFLIARVQPAPPVYDPGGPTALIDDFCVAAPARWADVGARLLTEARTRLKVRGIAQIIVVSPEREAGKMAMLKASGLSLASTWWTAAP